MPEPYPVTHTDAEWRQLLTPEQYRVMRRHGTEPPGSSLLLKRSIGLGHFAAPVAVPSCSNRKLNSRAAPDGRASRPGPGAIETTVDGAGMMRTEVHCPACGSHLGHVFDDGPPPT